jgi:hypothetical protein
MLNEEISCIVDLIEDYGKRFITHPNQNVKIFAASRLVDAEVARRMEVINQLNKETGFIVVGGVK